MKWPRFRSGPRPPENVVLHMADGTAVPVECIYTGLDEEGLHRWVVVPIALPEWPVGMSIDRLPGRTTVQMKPFEPGQRGAV